MGFKAQQHVPFATQTASEGLKMSENTNALAFLRTFLAKTESQDASLSCDFSFWDASIPKIHRCSSRFPLHLVASEPWDPLHRWAKPARWPLTFTLAGETQRDGDSLGLTGAGGHWWTWAFLWFWVGIDGSPGSWFCQGMTHIYTYIYVMMISYRCAYLSSLTRTLIYCMAVYAWLCIYMCICSKLSCSKEI